MSCRTPSFVWACLLIITGLPAVAQIPGVPRVPRVPGVDIPDLEDLLAELLRQEPPLTTTLDDVVRPVPWLDWFQPEVFDPIDELVRPETGGWQLGSGCYRFELQSYCLHPGTHGPYEGPGYLLVALRGSRAGIVRTALQQAGLHPDLPQRDIQLLLWGILSQTRLSAMDRKLRDAAEALLPPEMIEVLNARTPLDALSDASGELPASVRNRILRELPPELRTAYRQQLKIRSLLMRRHSSFEDIERLAVLAGRPRDEGEHTIVPRGRWSLDPRGYLVRFLPRSYSRTVTSVLATRPSTLIRDALGRITTWDLGGGYRVETDYDDAVTPLLVPEAPGLKAYAFAAIRWFAPTEAAPGGALMQSLLHQGWTFVGEPTRVERDERAQAGWQYATWFGPEAGPRYAQGGRIGEWRERYEGARERYDAARDLYDSAAGERSEADIDEFTDMGHYRDGVDAARGSVWDRLDWLINHREREAAAVGYATCVIAGTCAPPGGDEPAFPVFDPGGSGAAPGNPGVQRLGMSSR